MCTSRAISVLSELEVSRTGVEKLEQESGDFFLEGHAANSLNSLSQSVNSALLASKTAASHTVRKRAWLCANEM